MRPMDGTVQKPAEGPACWPLPWWLWLPALLGLFAWHGWLTLGLFGDDPLDGLLDETPIVSGAHPQHLYLGGQGSRALLRRGTPCVYDPASQVGYLKTPIFDGGRLAELALLCAGGGYNPAAYKIGLACTCLLVPVLLLLAARGAGLDRPAALLATLFGLLLWWGPHGRGALEAGDFGVNLASLAGLAHVGLLLAYHRRPGVRTWLGLWMTGALCWFLQPLLFPIALPVLLVYYLSVGVKHEFLTWHASFWVAQIIAVLVNVPWLLDWASYWWLRASLPSAGGLLVNRTLAGFWEAPIWGGPTDRLLALILLPSAVVGLMVLHVTRRRPEARLLSLGAGGALTLALLGLTWEPLGAAGTAALLAPALWFAALPAALAWTWLARKLWQVGPLGGLAAAGLIATPLFWTALFTDAAEPLVERCTEPRPFELGLSDERQELVETLTRLTTPEARVLWEDRAVGRTDSRWPALLPLLTERHYLGGLDPDGFIEPSSICLLKQALEQRAIALWKDDELARYCDRYNVGWVVAWSPAVVKRFAEWSGAERQADVKDGSDGVLFRVRRSPSYALKGRAAVQRADSEYIILRDVTPVDGEVVLSWHYQHGLRASPGRVQVERAPSGDDPIGFVRLRLANAAVRVTLTWQR